MDRRSLPVRGYRKTGRRDPRRLAGPRGPRRRPVLRRRSGDGRGAGHRGSARLPIGDLGSTGPASELPTGRVAERLAAVGTGRRLSRRPGRNELLNVGIRSGRGGRPRGGRGNERSATRDASATHRARKLVGLPGGDERRPASGALSQCVVGGGDLRGGDERVRCRVRWTRIGSGGGRRGGRRGPGSRSGPGRGDGPVRAGHRERRGWGGTRRGAHRRAPPDGARPGIIHQAGRPVSDQFLQYLLGPGDGPGEGRRQARYRGRPEGLEGRDRVLSLVRSRPGPERKPHRTRWARPE